VTWGKRGVEFDSECALAGLSDAAYRTHSEAIGWLYQVEDASCKIPKRLLGRFAGSSDTGAAIGELINAGFWKDAGAAWVVVHHAGVVRQSLAAQLAHREKERNRQRTKRRKVSANVRANVGANVGSNVAAPQTDRQTVGTKYHGALENQGQNHGAVQQHVGGEADDKRGSGLSGSAANPHKPRVHDGSFNPTSGVQQIPNVVQLQSPATDRNARATCPACGLTQRIQANGKIRRHGPQDAPCRGSGTPAQAAS
jgi:hypothetical protein